MKKLAPLAFAALAAPFAYAASTISSPGWVLSPGGSVYATESQCQAAVPAVNGTYHCTKDDTITVTGAAAPTTTQAATTTSYTTAFNTDENPLTEGGRWFRANNPWTNVRTSGGVAIGTNGVTNSYDDSYALFTAYAGGPDQSVEITVYRASGYPTSGASHEIEALLRFSQTSSSARGYECLFNREGGYEIVRWNGPFGSFTPLSFNGPTVYVGRGLVTGDKVKCTIVGSRISLYLNGQKLGEALDSQITSGTPGIGFFLRPGAVAASYGMTAVTIGTP